MPLISPHLREQIRAASDIVEVIQGYLPLRRAGGNFVALCPFHREKTPSFHVSPSRQAFHCFGCQKGGDVFRFVQDYENIPFVEAVKRLADRAGIRIEYDETPGQRGQREGRDQLRELHEQITQRWQQTLTSDPAGGLARDYLAARGVAQDATTLFRLGYAPDAWDDTVTWAPTKGWDLTLVEQAGLIIRKEGTDRFYDRFRGRLMFPICDEQGRVIGFSGRILRGDEKTAKYVNSPETPIFTKSRTLYGLDKTKRAILDAGSAIICEGQLDLIACHSAGVRNVVAPQGTALTGEHLRILRRYAQEVVLCFDSDTAGQKAAARILDELLTSGLAIRVISVPAPHDPDSYLKEHGPEAFRELVGAARDFFEFYLRFLCSQHEIGTDKGRLAVLDAMAAALLKAGNEVLFDHYAQRTAMVLAAGGSAALSPDAVRAEFRKRAARPDRPAPIVGDLGAGSAPPQSSETPPSPTERWLLKLLFLDDKFAGWVGVHLDLRWIRHPGVRSIVERRLTAHRDAAWHGPAAFLGELEDDALRSLASEAMADTRTIPHPEQQLGDIVTRLRNNWLDEKVAHLSLKVVLPDLPEAERVAVLHELQDVRRAKRVALSAQPSP